MVIEQLLKFPRGLARGSCPPSPVRMRALVEGYSGATWYYFLKLCSVPLQLIDFSMGWKLQSLYNLCFIQWTFVCLFSFSFGNSQTWYESTSMARILQASPHFQVSCRGRATQQAAELTPGSIFIVGTGQSQQRGFMVLVVK